MNNVNVKILNKEFFDEYGLPVYATPESAGMDIRACIQESIMIPAMSNERVLVGTGLAIDLDDPKCMWVLLPKSGLGHKKGLVLGNLVGVVDSDYHLEVFVSCWNSGPQQVIINRGDFICQAVLIPVLRVKWNVVTEFDRTVDRVGGFGSTGKR